LPTKAKRGSCVHHWIIEPAEGKTSQGRCEKCQEVRAFDNSIPDDQFSFTKK